VTEGLCFVPPVLSANYTARRAAIRESPVEILVAELGDAVTKSPYLLVSLEVKLITLGTKVF